MVIYPKLIIILIAKKMNMACCSCHDDLHAQEKQTLNNSLFL